MIPKAKSTFESDHTGVEAVLPVGALVALPLACLLAAAIWLTSGMGIAKAADSCPNAEIRAEQQSTFLPDCRAYELASHYPTGGVPIYEGQVVADSEAGDRLLFKSFQPLPLDNVMPFGGIRGYLTQRGETGWSTVPTQLPIADHSSSMSRDGSHVFETITVNADPDDQNVGSLGEGQDFYVRRPSGEIVWASRDHRIPLGTPQTGDAEAQVPVGTPSTSAASVDGSVIVFRSAYSLIDSDTAAPQVTRLYKWTDDGSFSGDLEVIGRLPDGSIPGGAILAGSSGPDMQVNTVSADGSRVAFEVGNQIYIHIEGQPSRWVANATGVPPILNPQGVNYLGADRDLNRLFFTTYERLTPDSGASVNRPDLYVYDVESDAVQDLTPRLDGGTDPEVDPLPEDQAQVRGVAGFSDDGKRIFFVADGQLDTDPSPEGDLPDAGGNNLYMAELDEFGDPVEVAFITTLSGGDADLAIGNWLDRTAYASPDGEVFGFGATTNLTDTDIGDLQQVFAYDAGEHTLECASCPADGSSPTSAVNLGPASAPRWQTLNGDGIKRWVSPDGSVLFHTSTQLSGLDTNSVDDVYAYRDGEHYLISAGSGERRSRLLGASHDGSTILFLTGDTLVPDDEEPGIFKIYAAVSEGGFPAGEPPEPACVGDACQGEATPQPSDAVPGSSAYLGEGNPPAKPNCSKLDQRAKKLKQRTKKLKRKARNAPKASSRAKKLKRKARKSKRKAKQAVAKTRACQSGAQS